MLAPSSRRGRGRPSSGGPRRSRRGRRLLVRVTAVLAVAALLYPLATFAQVAWTARHDAARPADAILVLGAAQYGGEPSPVFAARLDHAADLYARGLAPVVVVTGGSQPGDAESEARAADRYLQSRGVPPAALRLETGSSTTFESLTASARFLDAEGVRDVILVSDGWHLARSAAIAREVGLSPLPSPTPWSRYSPGAAFEQMVRESAGLALGRLIGFRRFDRLQELSMADLPTAVARRVELGGA